jgi:hypothetical protein
MTHFIRSWLGISSLFAPVVADITGAQAALISYEVTGTILVGTRQPDTSLAGQMFRVVFSYNTESIALLPEGSDGLECLSAYVDGQLFLGDSVISNFSFYKLFTDGCTFPAVRLNPGSHDPLARTEGATLLLNFGDTLPSVRPDGRLLAAGEVFEGGNSGASIAGDGLWFLAVQGSLVAREVPEPSLVSLAGLAGVALLRRRRSH